MVIRNGKLKANGTSFNKDYQCVAFANDLVLIVKSTGVMEKNKEMLDNEAKKYGLEIYAKKIKYMMTGKTEKRTEKELTSYTGDKYKLEK